MDVRLALGLALLVSQSLAFLPFGARYGLGALGGFLPQGGLFGQQLGGFNQFLLRPGLFGSQLFGGGLTGGFGLPRSLGFGSLGLPFGGSPYSGLGLRGHGSHSSSRTSSRSSSRSRSRSRSKSRTSSRVIVEHGGHGFRN